MSLRDFGGGNTIQYEGDPLTAAERKVYDAVEDGEMGVREYARAHDLAPGTVGNLLSRARGKLGEEKA